MIPAHKYPCGHRGCPQTFCMSDIIRQDQFMDACKEIDRLTASNAALVKERDTLKALECPSCGAGPQGQKGVIFANLNAALARVTEEKKDWQFTKDAAIQAQARQLVALRAELAKRDAALRHYVRRYDADGKCWNWLEWVCDKFSGQAAHFDWKGEEQDEPWQIAEAALSGAPVPVACPGCEKKDGLTELLTKYKQALRDHAADGCYCYKARPEWNVCLNDCGPAIARRILAALCPPPEPECVLGSRRVRDADLCQPLTPATDCGHGVSINDMERGGCRECATPATETKKTKQQRISDHIKAAQEAGEIGKDTTAMTFFPTETKKEDA